MSRRTVRFQIAAVATAVAAVTAAGVGSAAAHNGGGVTTYRAQKGGPGKPSSGDHCAFTVDGKPWTTGQGLTSITPTADNKISIDVTGDRGRCIVSLAAYLAHGPDFASSGKQVLVDFSTVDVRKGRTGTLTVTAPVTGCFAQIDLYKGSTEYDGGTGEGHGPAPEGPNGAVIGGNLLASWNGPTGGKDCIDTPPTSPTTSATPTGSGTPTETASATPTQTATTSAPATTGSGTPTVSTSASASSAAAVDDTSSPSPSGDQALASTGGGSNTGLLVGLAAALVAAGGGVTFALRRRGASGRAH